MDAEPARGSYPPPSILALPGIERVSVRVRATTPPPPIHHLFGLTPVDSGRGTSVFSMPASPWLQSVAGLFFAGTSALVADAPLGAAILSTLPAGVFGVTSELSMSFLRPAGVESGALFARARVIDAGRSLGLSEAIVEDASGRLLAHSTSRYFLRSFDVSSFPRAEPQEPPAYDTPDPYERPLPPVDASAFASMSGLEVFRAALDGTIPRLPFGELFGIRLAAVDTGSLTTVIRASEWLCSPARTIYGGILAYLADTVMTGAVGTTLPAGHSSATLDLKVQFLRPGLADGRDITARGEVVHRGKNIAVTRAELCNADGKPLVYATGSTMVLAHPWRSVAVADEESPDEA